MSILPRTVLISTADKTGVDALARSLVAKGAQILSTGGTAQFLSAQGIPVIEVSDYTGFPEMMGGRLKTLHPKIHGGILARRGVDEATLAAHGIETIDMVVVNLYPFRETIAKEGVTLEEAIEQIDIGGPTMIRAAAKNHQAVAVVVSPSDYPEVQRALESGGLSQAERLTLAARAFAHCADYDRAIADYLQSQQQPESPIFPETLQLRYTLASALRYGENPHQRAAFYRHEVPTGNSIAEANIRQGKPLSYNNIADADTALSTVLAQSDAACAIIKHANPCGVACGETPLEAYLRAWKCDPTSAFGGIIAFNRSVDEECAREIVSRQFVEVVLAPTFSKAALAIFAQKPNIRILELGTSGHTGQHLQIQSVHGGILVQDWDRPNLVAENLRTVSAREPSPEELADLLFAWKVVRSVKSNAIVLAKNRATIGIGCGQTSRVHAARQAVEKAREMGLETQGSVLAGDAFFPFRDGVDAAAAAGVRAIIQPGGSVRDEEVIAAANEHQMAMIFTGVRHFRH